MQIFQTVRLGFTCFILAILTLTVVHADTDTDGDGVTDSEEIAAGTNPNDARSVQLQALAVWHFTDGTLAADGGEQPVAQQNVSVVFNGYEGPGVNIAPSGANPVRLKYRATELSGKRNIAPVRGSIFLRYKPNWARCTGPGSWVTLFETTNFALRVKPDGSAIVFTNTAPGSTYTYQIALDTGECDKYWEYVLFTYSPEETSLSRSAPSTRIVGSGIAPPVNMNDPNNYISFGSTASGTGVVNAILDDIAIFNGPGVLSVTPTVISAIASNSPAAINLVWSSPTNAITFIKRRLEGGSTWTSGAALGTNYLDKAVTAGERYEYNLNTSIADAISGLPDDAGRFIKASVRGTPFHARGKIILLVDKTLTNAIETDLGAFVQNLVGDGWQVLRKDVPRHSDNTPGTLFKTNYWNITNSITPFVKSNYALFGSEIKYILSVGHVPIAYTGTTADDGHTSSSPGLPNHTGAWASDLYFGDVDGIWTDLATVTGSDFEANRNFAGDGKFDQNKIPANSLGEANLEIPVGRIDTANLPAFADSEAQLLIKYLRKNANYRNGLRTFDPEAMWWAQPGTTPVGSTPLSLSMAEEFVSKISPLKQPIQGDVFRDTRSFALGVQSGAGKYMLINDDVVVSANVHTTADVAAGIIHNPPEPQNPPGIMNTNVAFYFLRGSYFPDFGFTDNFMRAVMCSTNGGLAVGGFLSLGWRVDGLGVGQTIGNEIPDVVNAWGKSINSSPISARAMELLGDPTLHYPIVPPVQQLSSVVGNSTVTLNWPSPPGSAGCYVYRSTSGPMGPFTRISGEISGNSFTDSSIPQGTVTYMIRSFSITTSGGGSFTNLSQGAFSRPLSSADPANCCVPDQFLNEDVAIPAQSFSIGESAGDSGLTLTAFSSNPALLPASRIVLGGSGVMRNVSGTPVTNQVGSAVITIEIRSNVSTNYKMFAVTVSPVNDPPSFTKGPNQSVAQGGGAQSVSNWATAIIAGPANEAGQQISFVVTNDSPFLFSSQPAITPSGKLTFTPANEQRGIAQVTVFSRDDGGVANGGNDTSPVQNFTINIGLPLDSDGDGLPNDFEQVYGFNPNSPGDGALDWDGDGMTNAQELAAGTNPKDSRSSIRISSAASLSPTFALNFKTVLGKTYAVDLNDVFPSNAWQNLDAGIPGTGGSVLRLDATAGSSDRRIYRVATSGLGGETITSEYAGLCRFTCLGNSDTYVANPFLRPAAELGAVSSISGSVVQIRGAGNWQANQWVYNGAAQSNTYFLLFRSGPLAGENYTITQNDSDHVTLDLQGGSIAAAQVEDAVAIIPYWTLATIFSGGNGIHSSPSPAVRSTEVLVPNISGHGTNLSAAGSYYYHGGNWRRVGQGLAARNDDVILPDMYLIVRHNIGTSTVLTAEGSVLPGPARIELHLDPAKQDNFVALPRPVAVSLIDSGLVSGGAFQSSLSPPARADELFAFDNSVAAKNKSAASAYYFVSSWRQIGGGNSDHGADLVFQPGAAVIVRSGIGASAVWTNLPTY